ncbi:MAG: hypothetical protein IJ196_00020 [Prevotella sp.]|nr:hypothetical protein [Prevotella sp.]
MIRKHYLSAAMVVALLAVIQVAFVSCGKGSDDTRLVIITFDGLRWQELFSGADEELLGDTRFVSNPEQAKERFWADTPESRRELVAPFLWSYVPEHGYLIGNKNKDSRMTVSNTLRFSYPGYSEMFCGWADDDRIVSNDPIPNPNTSVLEVVNRDSRYKGQVMMLSSWESIRYAVNNDRAGIPASSAHEPCYAETPTAQIVQEIDEYITAATDDSERADVITYAFALEVLKKKHPKVFYVGFGDTDEWAHGSKYDRYLEAIKTTDKYIKRIVETCESDPFYKGKTVYMLTCDHGRGRGPMFRTHGADVRGAEETWFIAFGKGIPALGETSGNGPFFTKQLSASIASVLGVEFTPDNGVAVEPFDPEFYKAPEPPKAAASFKAVEASPKGRGLRYAYSEGDFMSVKEVIAVPVKASGVTPVFTTSMKQREDHFGLVFKGLLKIDKTGLYLLSLACDDGAKLWVDGQLLWDIDRDGGGFKEDYFEFESGCHRVEVQYFENYGGETIELGLVGEGINVENLPAEMLYHE